MEKWQYGVIALVATCIGIALFEVWYFKFKQPKYSALKQLIDDCDAIVKLAGKNPGPNLKTLSTAFAMDLRQFIQNCGDLTVDDRRDLQMAFDDLDSAIERKDWPKVAQVAKRDVYAILDDIYARPEEGGDESGPIAG